MFGNETFVWSIPKRLRNPVLVLAQFEDAHKPSSLHTTPRRPRAHLVIDLISDTAKSVSLLQNTFRNLRTADVTMRTKFSFGCTNLEYQKRAAKVTEKLLNLVSEQFIGCLEVH